MSASIARQAESSWNAAELGVASVVWRVESPRAGLESEVTSVARVGVTSGCQLPRPPRWIWRVHGSKCAELVELLVSRMLLVLNCPERAASEGPGRLWRRWRLRRRPRLLLAGGIRGRRRVANAEIAPNRRAYRALACGLAPSRSSGEAVVPLPPWARALIAACGSRRLKEASRTGPYLWSGTARTL